MKGNEPELSVADLQRQRDSIRFGLRRANLAAFVTLLIVLVLALLAVWAALRADRHARAAEAAAERLWQSAPGLVRANRSSGDVGSRQEALSSLAVASQVRPSLALRNEAIAALALTDVREVGSAWPLTERTTIAFDADLELCAQGNVQGLVRVVRVVDNQEQFRFQETGAFIHQLQFSADKHSLAVKTLHGHLFILDIRGGSVSLRTESMGYFDLSPDNRWLAAGTAEGRVRRFDLANLREMESLKIDQPVAFVRFSPDSRTLAVNVSEQIQLWDMASGKCRDTISTPAQVFSLCWSPRGESLALGCGDQRIHLWHRETRQMRFLSGHEGLVWNVAFNPQGTMLVSAGYDGTTRLWEMDSGRTLSVTQRGYALNFSRDGTRLGYMRTHASFGVWQIAPSAVYRNIALPIGAEPRIGSAQISPDGRLLAATQTDGVRLIDLASDRTMAFLPLEQSRSAHFTPDGDSLLVQSTRAIFVCPLEKVTLESQETIRFGTLRPVPLADVFSSRILEIASTTLSLDGKRALMCVTLMGAAGEATLLDLGSSKQLVAINGQIDAKFHSAGLSPDNQWIVTCDQDRAGTRVWNASTGALVRHLASANAEAAFSPDGRWLVNAAADFITIWRTGSWELAHRILRESASGLPGRLCFSPDGTLLAVAKSLRQVQLVHPVTGEELASLSAPDPRMVSGLSLSADNRLLAVVTTEGVVQLWNLDELRHRLGALGLDWGRDALTTRLARSGLAYSPAVGAGGDGSSRIQTVGRIGAAGGAGRHRLRDPSNAPPCALAAKLFAHRRPRGSAQPGAGPRPSRDVVQPEVR